MNGQGSLSEGKRRTWGIQMCRSFHSAMDPPATGSTSRASTAGRAFLTTTQAGLPGGPG